jgi:hypothetical protein
VTPVFFGLLGGLVGASVAAVSPSSSPALVGLSAGAIAFETSLLRPHLDADADSRLAGIWRRFELVGLVLWVKLLQVLSGNTAPLDFEFGLAVVVGVVVWSFVNATLTDLDAIERAIEVTDGMTPLQRIRLRFVALGLTVVLCAALGAVGLDGLLDLERGAARSWSPAPLGYFVLGLAGLGAAARMAEASRWHRDGAVIDPGVGWRWMRSVLVTLVLLGLVSLWVQSTATGATAVPVSGLGVTGRFGSWLSERAADLRSGSDSSGQGEFGDSIAATPPPFDVAEQGAPWLGEVALWTFVGLIFAFAIYRGRNRLVRIEEDLDERPGVRAVLALVWRAVTEVLASMWGALKRLFFRSGNSDAGVGGGFPEVDRSRRWWEPADPIRRRIAVAYRSAADVISVGHGSRRQPETPREFAGRVADERFTTVTEVFEEARYSTHHLDDSHASTAESAARELRF